MRTILLTIIITVLALNPSLRAASLEELHEGDLLFVVPASANAITTVTTSGDSPAVDHVAIVHYIGGEQGLPYALEAIGRGVCLTPIDSFREHHRHARIIVAQVDALDTAASVRRALNFVGRPYDWLYQHGDSAIYCSELVQMCYRDTGGQHIYPTIGMTFRDASGRIPQFWIDLYDRHGLPVPEGEPGTNPAQLLRHSATHIITIKH
ncbi:MAG: hypothetical protein IJ775_04735 [Muribaculaceae bacterium]|nr:hypothetical protein [Muribaculaceae bacterium]